MAANRLSSKTWSAETLLRGFQVVANQPAGELLPSNDGELLRELQDIDRAKSVNKFTTAIDYPQIHGLVVRNN